MASTAKVSVAMGREELRLAKTAAREAGVSLSAFVTEAVRDRLTEKRRREAALDVLAMFDREDLPTAARERELLELWSSPPEVTPRVPPRQRRKAPPRARAKAPPPTWRVWRALPLASCAAPGLFDAIVMASASLRGDNRLRLGPGQSRQAAGLGASLRQRPHSPGLIIPGDERDHPQG